MVFPRPPGLFETYRQELKIRNYSPRTIKTYLNSLHSFVHYFYPTHPRDLSLEEINKYLLHLIEERSLGRSSVDQSINALKFLYVKLYKRTEFQIDLKRPRKDRKLPVVLSRDEVLQICMSAGNSKHRLILELMYAGGLRVSEVIQIKVQDFDLDRLTLFVRAGKGRKDRLTIFSQVLREPLLGQIDHKKAGDLVFPGPSGKKLTTRAVQKVFKEALLASGIKKNATCHSLRHSFATHLLESGVDIRYIQSLLGHARIETTNLYTKVRNPHLFQILSPL